MKPIEQRIKEAFGERDWFLYYPDLARRVFPLSEYPKAWRYSSNGGPPGCYMALSAAIRRMGLTIRYEKGRKKVLCP